MTITDFKGAGRALDKYDVPQLAYRIGVSEDHLQAFLNVESRSQGFDRAGRPVILTEPHVFYRNLRGAERDEAVRQGLAYPKWGQKPYPKTSDARYQWLKKAMAINVEAALKACSWGSSQVLGENFSVVGFSSAEEMVRAFMRDEEEHVEAMVKFILVNGIADDLRAERWRTVARIYNGPGYEKNGYHTKMAREYAKLTGIADSGWKADKAPVEIIVPDAVLLKRIQRRLGELRYTEVGWADGKMGSRTRAGIVAFRVDSGLPIYDGIDSEFITKLFGAPERDVGEERASSTVADLRAANSRIVDANDATGIGGAVTAVGGGVAGTAAVLKQVEEQAGTVSSILSTVEPYMDLLIPALPWVALAVGAFVWWNSRKSTAARLDDQRSGKTAFAGPV